ncbi:MAG: ribonuclease [Candidatus Accumulibacter sp.]|jgi:ribonuclease T1|nr:ribonuclease [Accumulibacter sp.]
MKRLTELFRLALLLMLAAFISGHCPAFAAEAQTGHIMTVRLAELPREARETLALIRRGGPFPFPRSDGSIFGNFEKRLPKRPHGYYREYTVPAPAMTGDRPAVPGVLDRGARRIVAGKGREYYYTVDHYRTFRRIRE